MEHPVEEEFRQICKLILAHQKTASEWAEIEADDMFQSSHYVGGFDADEMAFCFSVFRSDGEYWFQLSLAEVERVQGGQLNSVEIRAAEL